jgi:DNA repair protein RecN (Recombination protein N)
VLVELHIENLGVIEDVRIDLGPGLTTVTGETGAGKTMIVEAISLLVGSRADATVVRTGCDEARVEGRFVTGDDELILARVVPKDGRSRAYVNGRLATVGQLEELGGALVDMHGQHDQQGLLSVQAQREALDEFAGVDLTELRAAREHLTQLDALLATLGGDERARAREIDLLRFQVREITEAGLTSESEDDDLSSEEDLLADISGNKEAMHLATSLIGDDDGIADLLGQAISALGHRDSLSPFVERLRAVQMELQDVAAQLRDTAESIDEDPTRLEEIRVRRQLLVDLRRKYGEAIGDVIAYGDEARRRLDDLESLEARAATLDVDRQKALEALQVAQSRVLEKRRDAAPRLARDVQKVLRTLAMPHVVVGVEVDGEAGERVLFTIAANPGSPPLPLNKVASGGELARTMLSLRLVLGSGPECVVFDEVDAGIGGEAAVAVASALAELGKRRQVLVVTHLAQVAARASTHIHVSKSVQSGVTVATARALEGTARVHEVARMLSGGAEKAAVAHAEELLASGKPAKKGSVRS